MTAESSKERALAMLNSALDEWEDKVAALQATLVQRDQEIADLKTQSTATTKESKAKLLKPSEDQIAKLSEKIKARKKKQEDLKQNNREPYQNLLQTLDQMNHNQIELK